MVCQFFCNKKSPTVKLPKWLATAGHASLACKPAAAILSNLATSDRNSFLSHWQAESSPKHASNASIQQGQVHPAVNSLNKNVLMIKVVLYFLFSIYSCQHLQSLKMSEISSYLHISFTLNLIYKQILLARSLDKSKANDQPSAHMPWSHCCSLKSQFVSFRKKVSGWFSGFWWTFELPFYTMLCWWFVDDFLKIIFCAVHHNLWLMVDDFPSHPSSKTLSFQAHFIRLNALAEHLLLRVIT